MRENKSKKLMNNKNKPNSLAVLQTVKNKKISPSSTKSWLNLQMENYKANQKHFNPRDYLQRCSSVGGPGPE